MSARPGSASARKRIGASVRSRCAVALVVASGTLTDAAPTAALVPVIDQQQSTDNALLGTFQELAPFAQSFVPGFDNVAGAGLVVQGPGDPGNGRVRLTLELWSSLDAPGPPLVSVAIDTRPNEWADALWQPVAVKAGSEYFLVFRDGIPPQAASLGANDDLYPAGAGYFSNRGQFEPVDGFNFAFRTDAMPIPEPHSYLLLLAGLFAVAAAIRRSRAA